MSDTKQIAGGIIGGAIGFFIGGPAGAAKGFLIGVGVGAMYSAIRADVPTPGKPQTDEFEFAKAKEGLVINDLLGTSKVSGGNIFIYGNNRSEEITEEVEGGKGGGSQTVVSGYEFYLSWAQGICLGPVDVLYTVYREDHCVWSGELECPASGGVESITLEGMGEMQFFFGTDDQEAPDELKDLAADSTLCPDYKRLCYAFFNDCSIGSYNRAPNMRFVIRKSPEFSFAVGKHVIEDYKYNPAHAFYYILANKVGLNSDYVDSEISFEYVADVLYHEPIGVSILMDRQLEALSYLETLISHIGGILIWNIAAKLELSLVREEKHTARMLTVDDSVIDGDLDLSRNSWIETINDIKVQFSQIIIEPEPCSLSAPTLALVDCDTGHGKGDYLITGGCPPYKLQWKFSGATEWKHKRVIYGTTFTDICESIYCSEAPSDRLIRVVDNEGQASNTLTISSTGVTILQWAGDRKIDYEGNIDIVVIGGKPPYFWSFQGATGLGFWFDSGYTLKELVTYSATVALYHDGANCPPAVTIVIEDDCLQQVTGNVTGDDLAMTWGGDEEVEDFEGSVEISVNGGRPGYSWTVTGANLWFDSDYTQKTILTVNPSVRIYCDGEQCSGGAHYVSCSDTCDNLVSGYVTIQDPDTFEFNDAATPDTVAPGGSITLYILGGVPPYTWNVTGEGYSLEESETEGLSNVLSCVDGSCAVDYDLVAYITVTDSCNEEVDIEIRSYEGEWIEKDSGDNAGNTFYVCGEGNAVCAARPDIEYIVGEKRWMITVIGNCVRNQNRKYWKASLAAENYPPCGNPWNCAIADGTCGYNEEHELWCYCRMGTCTYYELECT